MMNGHGSGGASEQVLVRQSDSGETVGLTQSESMDDRFRFSVEIICSHINTLAGALSAGMLMEFVNLVNVSSYIMPSIKLISPLKLGCLL
jgi:hypothetical protein